MVNPRISAVVPCRDEEKSLPSTIRRLKKVADEIIVVDNGSTDRSLDVARSLGVRVISEPRQRNGSGYGFAHLAGFAAAKGKIIVTADADGEHPVELIPQIIRFAQDGKYDFVSCARATAPNGLRTKIRRFGVFLFSLQVGLLFGTRIKDPLCGMWIFRRAIVPMLSLSEGGWNLSPEIKLSALTNPKIRFAEYPIPAAVRENGRSKQILWKTAIEHGLFITGYRLSKIGLPDLRPLIRLRQIFKVVGSKS